MDVEAGSSYQNDGDNPSASNQPSALAGGQNKVKALQTNVDELTSVMQSNINKVLERGDRMDTLNERSELLSSRANEFRINSRNVRRKMWWENMKWQLIIGAVIITIIFLVIYAIWK